jgi:putative membrane protein
MRIVHRCLIVAFIAAPLVVASPALTHAQGPVTVGSDQSTLAPTDHAFAHAAAEDAQAEIALARLAQQTTSSDIVRTFAEAAQHDYVEAADRLRQIGDLKHDPMPVTVSNADQIGLDKLSQLSGSAFDRAFVETVIAGHQDAIQAFQLYAATGTDAELRGFADRMLPKLRKQLSAAEDVRKSVAE